MITIRVISFNGQPPAQPIGAEFDELGGTIGRADTNQLALPDPERHVSRLQARIAWSNGQFQIINVGANAMDVAGHSIANGSAAAIRPGDRITIGGYVLEVSSAGAAAAAGSGEAAGASGPPVDDPLGLFGGTAKGRAGEDLFPAAAPSTPASSPAAPARPEPSPRAKEEPAPRQAAVIPEDFDPFADPFASRPAPKEAVPPPLDDLGFGPKGESVAGPGIDTMFGLGAGKRPPGADVFEGSALEAPPAGKDDEGKIVEPLAALSGVPVPPLKDAAVPDQVPEVRGSYRPPVARMPADAFLSWEQPDAAGAGGEGAGKAPGEESPPIRPRVEVELSFAPPPRAVPVEEKPVAPAPEPATAPLERVAVAAAPDADAMQAAFLRGLGLPDLAFPRGLTPETMESIGRLLREAAQGTLDLLLARAMTKREIRAEVTMIVAHDNNPLKFSPNVEVALAHLLAPHGKGFLPPLDAMRDAYDDLRSHEIGFMAGMRAALAGVLQRFDPVVLEQHLSAKSVLDSLLPMNRRARLWDLYTERYREIAKEAEDDFHALFGREFLRAYEEQVTRLHDRSQ